MLVDTHCHLDFEQFDPDRDAVIQRAGEAGINYFVISVRPWIPQMPLVSWRKKYAQVYAGVGIHRMRRIVLIRKQTIN